MKILRIHILSCLIIAAACTPASADFIYAFGQSDYEVASGGQVDVQVFLQQVGSETLLTDEGLLSASVRVFFAESPVPSDPAQVLAISDINPDPLFDDKLLGGILDLDPGISAGFIDSVDDLSSPLFGDSILLGTFTFTAGNVVGEVTYLRATDFDLIFDDTIAGNFSAIEASIGDGFATITVSAVPESSSLAMAGFGAICISLACRRRDGRRRTSQPSAAAQESEPFVCSQTVKLYC